MTVRKHILFVIDSEIKLFIYLYRVIPTNRLQTLHVQSAENTTVLTSPLRQSLHSAISHHHQYNDIIVAMLIVLTAYHAKKQQTPPNTLCRLSKGLDGEGKQSSFRSWGQISMLIVDYHPVPSPTSL